MADRIAWGILGTGNIARQFAAGLKTSRRGTPAAVGSRAFASAERFAHDYGVHRALGSYDALLADPGVDAVYLSLPNNLHHQWTIKALRAGKHVLCEKPLASNAAEAAEMFDEAEKAGRLLVEAFMYRSHPLTLAVESAVRDGAIGSLRMIRSSFCYRTTRTDGNIRFDPALAGGAMMDIGCYCLNFSRFFAGTEPTGAEAYGHIHPSGIDDYAAGILHFPGDLLATFTCGMTVQADNTAYLLGTDGYIEIPIPWKPPAVAASYTIARSTPPRMDQPGSAKPSMPPRQTFTVDAEIDLYALEADDFAAAALDGAPVRLSREDSIGNMRLLDLLRRQIGVTGDSRRNSC